MASILKDLNKRKKDLQERIANKAMHFNAVKGLTCSLSASHLQNLQELAMMREILKLEADEDRLDFQIKAEEFNIWMENERMKHEKGFPPALVLVSPASGDPAVRQGTPVIIRWEVFGPIGSKLIIFLKQGGVPLNAISGPGGVSKYDKEFKWSMPKGFPFGDYEIVIKDPDTGLEDQGELHITR